MLEQQSHSTTALRVVVFDPDYYAASMIARCLAWDRRTHVRKVCKALSHLWEYLDEQPAIDHPEVVVLTGNDHDIPTTLHIIHELRHRIPGVKLVCLVREAEYDFIQQVVNAGVNAICLKSEVGLSLSWVILLAQRHPLVTMPGIIHICGHHLLNHHSSLPACIVEKRTFPEMTGRIHQAVVLSVIFGLPVHIVADEMCVSTNTVRGYIKEGYRILEAAHEEYGDVDFPELSPQERALMYLTSLHVRQGF